jgi:hypothetical protein
MPGPKKKAVKAPALFRINIEVSDDGARVARRGCAAGPAAVRGRARVFRGRRDSQVVGCMAASRREGAVLPRREPVHERAKKLGWLSKEKVHGEPGGEIAVRPWGERSFYAKDAWGNPLCFVEDGTVYPG